jgi:pilus assembly protein CpaE
MRMQSFLVCDHELIGGKVRQALLREGLDCPASNVVRFDLAGQRPAAAPPELVVIVLSPDPQRAMAVLTRLRSQSQAHIMAIGQTLTPQLILQALRGGADDYVDEVDLDAELTTALRRWQDQRTVQGPVGRTVAVVAPSGGSGSSTLTASIATVLASTHQTVALLDLKLEQGDQAALFDLKPTYTLADICQNIARMDRSLFERSLVRHASGVHLLAPPRLLPDLAHVTAEGVQQVLALARTVFPYVVVDLHPLFPDVQAPIVQQADTILLVLRLDFVSLRNARRCLERLERMGVDKNRVRLVANRHGQPGEVLAARAEEALGVKIAHYVPDDPKTVNRANNNGVPVVLEAPSAKISKSIAALAASLNGRASTP